MSFLGIDASLTATGWCLVEEDEITDKGTFKAVNRGAQRLFDITHFLGRLIAEEQPEGIAIEGPSYGSFMGRIVDIGELHGAIKLIFVQSRFPRPVYVAPTTLKKFITGNGRGEKSDVKMAILKHWGVEIPDNNQADAFGLAQIARYVFGEDEPKHKYQKEGVIMLRESLEVK